VVSLTFFIVSSICPSITVVAVFGICALLWSKGWPIARAIILILALLGICVASFFWGPYLGGPDKWNILLSIATLLGVIVALFYDEIQKLIHFAKITFYVGTDLIDPSHGVRWVRGRIGNTGDRAVKRCRLKLLRVEGQPSQIENGFLQWQGGIRGPIRLSSKEHLIFDIGTRAPDQGSPLELLAYIGDNRLVHNLPAGGNYRLVLAIYGDNIRTRMQTISIAVGEAADNIQIW
jgi:hypothetical protein